MLTILQLLNLKPSAQSIDYVENKTQFHLFNLLTEQRHAKTWNLSFTIQSDTGAGLRMLLAVDQDISAMLANMAQDPRLLEQATSAVVEAIYSGHHLYFYGCGATGRLAKQMESSFWRPFWKKVKQLPCWKKLEAHLPPDIEERVTGEMTGADRALVSSLEGFEDLQLIGRLQLQDHGIRRGDVVFCVTEGGETSSVIGTILAALDQYGDLNGDKVAEARRHLYFVYNNPDPVLRPFARSASVIDNPAITKINLTTGPQSITGSTRMQATTSETFVLGVVLEEAIARILRRHLSSTECAELGFGGLDGITARLASFDSAKKAVDSALPQLAKFTDLEANTYRNRRFSTYYAKQALITVFIDNTERSPTFRLYPLDKVQDAERQCWLQVWTEAANLQEAWQNFLGRRFRGLESSFYKRPFEEQVTDPYLREAALRSLINAGNDQELNYDFSFSGSNVERRGPQLGDLGVMVLLDEEILELEAPNSSSSRFFALHQQQQSQRVLVHVAGAATADHAGRFAALGNKDLAIRLVLDQGEDPLTLRRQMALKMLLNAHSTGIMAMLGRVVGNTMTNVSPSNLKLIGRATYLILSHVNDTLRQSEWTAQYGPMEALSFAEVNAVLMDAIDYVRTAATKQTAEVALSIIRILEALRRQGPVTWQQAQAVLDQQGLAAYLVQHNPALNRAPQ